MAFGLRYATEEQEIVFLRPPCIPSCTVVCSNESTYEVAGIVWRRLLAMSESFSTGGRTALKSCEVVLPQTDSLPGSKACLLKN
ncbi:MAG: hypothetical protein ACI8P0_001662 [Planctomycetaceae bacterium]